MYIGTVMSGIGGGSDRGDPKKQKDPKHHVTKPSFTFGFTNSVIEQLRIAGEKEEADYQLKAKRSAQAKFVHEQREKDLDLVSLAFSLLKQDLGGTINFTKINPLLVHAYIRAALQDGLPNTDHAKKVANIARNIRAAKQENKPERSPELVAHILQVRAYMPALKEALKDPQIAKLRKEAQNLLPDSALEDNNSRRAAQQLAGPGDPSLNLQANNPSDENKPNKRKIGTIPKPRPPGYKE